jgi:hypothetical protein
MSLWDTMFYGWVTWGSLQRAECALARYSSFKLPLNFLRCALFERVGAATQTQACDRE